MARVLVTGGAGFIGSHLTEALVAQGHVVRVLDDLSTGSLANIESVVDRVEFTCGSVCDSEAVRKAARGVDCVFHLAAIVSVQESIVDPDGTRRVNLEGTRIVGKAACEAGARVVFSSSAAVYGDVHDLPVREDVPKTPISPYGKHKLEGELLLEERGQRSGLPPVCLRYFNVFGPRQDPSSPYSGVISIFVRRLLAGEGLTIFGDGEQTRDFIDVSDVVRANLAAMVASNSAAAAANVGTGRETSLNQLVESLFSACGVRVPVNYEKSRPGDIRRSVCDPSLAKEALGFRAEKGFEEGLKRLVDWARTQ